MDNGNGNKLTEYRFNELKGLINDGFKRVDEHLEKQDDKISELYIWKAAIETKTLNINSGLSSRDLGKIILAIIAALTLALTIISQTVGK